MFSKIGLLTLFISISLSSKKSSGSSVQAAATRAKGRRLETKAWWCEELAHTHPWSTTMRKSNDPIDPAPLSVLHFLSNTLILPAHGRTRLFRFAIRPASARPWSVALSSRLLSCSAHPVAPHPGPPGNQRRVELQHRRYTEASSRTERSSETILVNDHHRKRLSATHIYEYIHGNTAKERCFRAFLVEPLITLRPSTTYLSIACDAVVLYEML